MSAGWVAASVRARTLSQRRLGAAATRALASSSSVAEAVEVLADSPYGHDVRPGQSLAQAQHTVGATLLWHMRVLAGWVPRGDSRILRILAGGFEVANVDERLRDVGGASTEPAYHLGGLATAWTNLAGATSAADMRERLARSAWGDPGSDSADGVRLGMRLSWAVRIAGQVPRARPWAAGAAALVAARALLVEDVRIPAGTALVGMPLLGAGWHEARGLAELRAVLPPEARWALGRVEGPEHLWRAESAWWRRLSGDGFALLRRPVTTAEPVLGSLAVLACDAWRVRAALEVADRGGSAEAMEAFDAVA